MSTTDSTAAGSTPGAQSHVPGEDDTDSSVGGVVPDGGAMEHLGDSGLPGVSGASNGGDSVGDDTDPVSDDGTEDDSPMIEGAER